MMSDIQTLEKECIGRVDVEECGNSLRVASYTPHLISLGFGRLSTAVTIHPLQQGKVILGTNSSCDIPIQGTGVEFEHCKIENSNGVVTLYPIKGDTTIDGVKAESPVRLSQGSMIGIGRSNYLRFNHPEEAKLMKSVLPNNRISMAPIQFLPQENYEFNQDKGNMSNGDMLVQAQAALDNELEMLNKKVEKRKPPVAPRRFKDFDQTSNSSSSDQEVFGSQQSDNVPKINSIMSKVSKFEFYVKNSQRNNSKSTTNNESFSPKVFTSNSLTGNIAAKDVLITKNNKVLQPFPSEKEAMQRTVFLNENNAIEARNCSYTNVVIKNPVTKIDHISKTFDQNKNNPSNGTSKNKPVFRYQTPSSSFNRNPTFTNAKSNDTNESSNMYNQKNDFNRHQDTFTEENQRYLEQAHIDEILNMFAEYEKQNSIGIPTTPTEKKVHNKIITNGSLPRGYHNNPSVIQTSDGCYRFDAAVHRTHQMNSPEFNRNASSPNFPSPSQIPEVLQNIPIAYTANKDRHLNYENVYEEDQDDSPQSTHHFPITELSSPVMIRKIARNAQSMVSTYIGVQNPKSIISPYENVTLLHSQANNNPTNYMPKSPNTNSPRTRIKTTYTNRNAAQPQHFIFPSPPPNESINPNNIFSSKCQGIERQLSLDDDIPMIDDTNFANELEMRIARLKPENREKVDNSNDFIIDPLQNEFLDKKNFEDIKRDLLIGIPEFDALRKDIDRNLANNEMERSNNRPEKCLEDLAKALSNIPIGNKTDYMLSNKSLSDELIAIEKKNQELSNNLASLKEKEDDDLKTEPIVTKEYTVKVTESSKEKEDEIRMKELDVLYTKRKDIMNQMKDVKTEIHDLEFSRKQCELELDEYEMRLETLQDGLQVEKDIRKDEIDMAAVSESDKVKFKMAQDERHTEMKDMQKKLEQAEENSRSIETSFTAGDSTLDELRQAQENLENDKKLFEDMEFQHLEKESEFYSRIAKEQNVLRNDPWGTCKKIKKIEKLMDELLHEMKMSENHMKETNNYENPHLKKLLDDLSNLEEELCDVNKQINEIKKKIGIYRINERKTDLENYKARIKSGDFSPPTSDDDDMNEIKDRVRQEDQNGSIKEENENHDEDLEDLSGLVNDKVKQFDPMSMSMFVETHTEYKEVFGESPKEDSVLINDSIESKDSKNEEKKGFWERNFDSLTRLKNKDKKNNKSHDIMSQSLNENMFYNNENIESEFKSFENNLKSPNSKSRELNRAKSDESTKSKIPFSNISKIIRGDSVGKKNKENAKHIADDKENVDINVDNTEKHEELASKNVKHRYLKNSKGTTTDNKYANKSNKMIHSNNSSNSSNNSLQDKNSFEELELSGSTVSSNDSKNKIAFRKSAGDEIKKNYGESGEKFSICNKIPSQDDIDRISKVTLDAPLFKNNGEFNSLGRKTIDSLRELERNRVAIMEQKGCEVIENEREKMFELKKRIQSETTLKWEENQLKSAKNESNIIDNELYESNSINDSIRSALKIGNSTREENLSSAGEEKNESKLTGTDFESSNVVDSTLEFSSFEKSLRHSQSDSYNSSAYIEDERSVRHSSPNSNYSAGQVGNNNMRPLSELSDMSSDNGVTLQPLVEGPRRSRKASSNSLNGSFMLNKNREDIQRPLTRYLPIDKEDLNLKQHIESAGHQVVLCPHILLDETSCRGYLHKLGAKFHGWSKRWFVFDRMAKTLVYYSDKNEKKPRGGAYFTVIEEVYLDHLNVSKSPSPLTTFVIKTRQRHYYLMAPSGPAARIWIDVVFTGAQGYTEYMQ